MPVDTTLYIPILTQLVMKEDDKRKEIEATFQMLNDLFKDDEKKDEHKPSDER